MWASDKWVIMQADKFMKLVTEGGNTMTSTKEALRKLSYQNSDAVAELSHKLDIVVNLQSQVAWLLESFDAVDSKNDDSRYYFLEWHTKLKTIEALFTYVKKDIVIECEKLEGFANDFRELTQD